MQTAKKRRKDLKKNLPLLLLTVPGLIYLIINNYMPMFGIFIAFKQMDYAKGLFGSPWCGLANFKFLFASNQAGIMIRNTVLYNLAFILLGTFFAVLIAVLMSEIVQMGCAKFFQAGLVMPNLISMVIVSYIVYAFLSPENGPDHLPWRRSHQLVYRRKMVAADPCGHPDLENRRVFLHRVHRFHLRHRSQPV